MVVKITSFFGAILKGLFFGLYLLSYYESFTQTQNEQPKFAFSYDLNRYYNSDSLTYLEFTADIYRTLLKYVPHEDKYECKYWMTVELLQNDSLIASKQVKHVDTIDSLAQIKDTQRLYSKNYFVVAPGEYTFKMKMEDPNSGQTAEQSSSLKIAMFQPESLAISDIQLASFIIGDTSQGFFVKNGYRVIPNPSGFYGIGLPVLYSYAEIYNLAETTGEPGTKYSVTYKILKETGEVVKSYVPKERIKPGASSVDVNRITVVALVSGRYKLVMEVKDLQAGAIAVGERSFYVYREADFAEKKSETEKPVREIIDEYARMSEKELDQEFEYMRYLTNKKERKIYKQLSLEGRRRFLKEYWPTHNPYPESPPSKFKEEYLERIDYANKVYGGRFKDGWRIDRGRILIIYGHPDEIERNVFGGFLRSHEIWHYWDLPDQGAADFIFVDRRELGNLELVHSTARGEIYDTDWRRWLN